MSEYLNPKNYDEIDDFIKAIESKYETKKRNNYEDESLTVSPDGAVICRR